MILRCLGSIPPVAIVAPGSLFFCLVGCSGLVAAPSALASASAAVESTTAAAEHAGAAVEVALPELPVGLASFGAAALGERLYVYGGHAGKVHSHSIDDLSNGFFRLDRSQPDSEWERLGDIEPLQGLALVAWGDEVCRVGGLSARNRRDETEDLHSVSTVACWSDARGSWRDLPNLPEGRSSHDAVVVEDRLYVGGGWQLGGEVAERRWHDTLAILDDKAGTASWREVEQPFQRRALAMAAAGSRVFVIGGITDSAPSDRVDIFDLETGSWSRAPDVPPTEGGLHAFGAAALGMDEAVLLSTADGRFYRLPSVGDAGDAVWRTVATEVSVPRFFHRMLHVADEVLLIAGATSDGHSQTVASLPAVAVAASAEVGPAPVRRELPSDVWPEFRGGSAGRTAAKDLPLTWSSSDGAEENIAWTVALEGFGQSAPVVWKDTVFVTSAAGETKNTLILAAYALDDGALRWQRKFATSLPIEASDMVSNSAPTPVVDGERIVALWESGDLIAVDHDGEDLWRRSLSRELAKPEGNHGWASSPTGVAGAVIVQLSHEGPSYMLAIDRATGDTRWLTDRAPKVSWTTPLRVDADGREIVVASISGQTEAIDARFGEVLWSFSDIEGNNVPSAVAVPDPDGDGHLVVLPSRKAGNVLALRPADGRLGADAIAWRAEGVTSSFASPIHHGDCVVMVNRPGVASCVDVATGAERWQHRTEAGATWASPIATDDRLYLFGKDGITSVLELDGDEVREIATNPLEIDGTVYGSAAVDGAILLRTGDGLWRVGGGATVASTGEAGADSGEQTTR